MGASISNQWNGGYNQGSRHGHGTEYDRVTNSQK